MKQYVRMSKVQSFHIVDVIHGNFGKTRCGRNFTVQYSTIVENCFDNICKQCQTVDKKVSPSQKVE